MKKSRSAVPLSESLNHRLSQYAFAAGAAGVGVLALSQPVEAKVVYTRTHEVIKLGSEQVSIDLNHDGIIDFLFFMAKGSHTFYSSGLGVLGCSKTSESNSCFKNSVLISHKSDWAAALPEGFKVGQKGGRSHRVFMAGVGTNFNSHRTYTGNWRNVKNRYLGLEFKIKGEAHFGWARLSATIPPIRAVLTGYAYETIPNKPIITGKTKGPDVITLEPGSLGWLAQGSAGLLGK
jgi:hypothetical protein